MLGGDGNVFFNIQLVEIGNNSGSVFLKPNCFGFFFGVLLTLSLYFIIFKI